MFNRLRSILRAVMHRDRFEDGMREEMRFHIESYAADLERRGLSPAEAARRARMEFGNVDALKQDARQARGLRLVDELWQDLRYALRLMRKTPGFTAAAILSLSLGIGANTAIFSLADAVLLRMLPVADPQRLYFLAHGEGDRPSTSANYPLFERYRSGVAVFSDVAAYRTTNGVKVQSGEDVELVSAQFVSGNYHAVVGAPVILGRGFTSEPDRPDGRHPIAVISERYWTRRFGRVPDVLGKTLLIQGRAVSIVGVTAAQFTGLIPGSPIDITLPLSVLVLDQRGFLEMHDSWISMPIVARLRPDATEGQALAVADAVYQQYMSEPDNRWAREDSRPGSHAVARLLPAGQGSASLRREYSEPLFVLMSMVGLVLVIACANVANLLLARASARAKEVAIRACVGGGRGRLIRQFLTESVILVLAGGALGLLLAAWGSDLLVQLLSTGEEPVILDVSVNPRVLGFAAVVSLATGIAFGLAPALRTSRVDLTPALKESGPALGSARRGSSLGKALVVAQVALSVIVIAIAGLLGRSVVNLKSQHAGFEPANILLFTVDTFGTDLPPATLAAIPGDLVARLRAIPGVRSASCSTSSPVHSEGNTRGLELPDLPRTPEARGVWANVVTPEYFQTLGVRLLRGRGLDHSDNAGSRRVAVVNETMARYVFGDVDPIGRSFRFMSAPQPIEVVGLAQDTHQETLREQPPRMVYTPLAQSDEPVSRVTVAVKAAGDPALLAGSVREVVRQVSPDLVVNYVRTMDQQINASLVRERALTMLSTAFGVLALLLACVGLYGVMSYNVTRRTREIGIRIALGARRYAVLGHVLREVVAVSLVGVLVGIGGALVAAREVSSFLFGLSPRDPVTLAAVAAILLATTLIAGYCRRAVPPASIRCVPSAASSQVPGTSTGTRLSGCQAVKLSSLLRCLSCRACRNLRPEP